MRKLSVCFIGLVFLLFSCSEATNSHHFFNNENEVSFYSPDSFSSVNGESNTVSGKNTEKVATVGNNSGSNLKSSDENATVTVTLHSNYGVDQTVSFRQKLYTYLNEPKNTFTRDGAVFDGWIDSPCELYEYKDATDVSFPYYVSYKKNIDLYAKWRFTGDVKNFTQNTYKNTTLWAYGLENLNWDKDKQLYDQYRDHGVLKGNWLLPWKKKPAGTINFYASRQLGMNTCWGNVSGNIISWWMDVNRDNIRKYNEYLKKETGDPTMDFVKFRNEAIEKYNKEHHTNFETLKDSDFVYDNATSNIYWKVFNKYFADTGSQAMYGLDWFMNGTYSSALKVRDTKQPTGGFFKDVFNGLPFSKMNGFIRKRTFIETVLSALKQKQVLFVNYSRHVITVWGAHFDAQGNIDTLYCTNSESQHEGIADYPITYKNNGNEWGDLVLINGNLLGGIGYTLDSKPLWDAFFKTHKY